MEKEAFIGSGVDNLANLREHYQIDPKYSHILFRFFWLRFSYFFSPVLRGRGRRYALWILWSLLFHSLSPVNSTQEAVWGQKMTRIYPSPPPVTSSAAKTHTTNT